MQKLVIKLFMKLKPFKYSKWFYKKYFFSILFERSYEPRYIDPICTLQIIYHKRYRQWMWLEKK